MKKLCLLLLLIPLVFVCANTGDPIDKIAGLIRKGDVQGLSKTFDASVELTIMDQENICSPQQAASLLANFFKQNPPRSVRVLHRISSNGNYRFAVIILNTENGIYRTSFSLKNSKGEFLLSELRIEPEKTK